MAALLCSVSVSVFADDEIGDSTPTLDFFSWLKYYAFGQHWVGNNPSSVCSLSPTGAHEWCSNPLDGLQLDFTDVSAGPIYSSTCIYCGVTAYQHYKDNYDQHVQQQDYNSITDDGSILWYPDYIYIMAVGDFYDHSGSYHYSDYSTLDVRVYGKPPVSGTASLLNSGSLSLSWAHSGYGTSNYSYTSYDGIFVDSSRTYSFFSISPSMTWRDLIWSFPCYSITSSSPPYDPSSETGTDYSLDTRPTGLTLPIIDITNNTVINQTIVNETNKTVYNPVTNNHVTYNNYTYNYTDREYTFNIDGGDSIKVKFGDTALSFDFGDTTNNYYYYIDAACEHEYEEQERYDSTCNHDGYVVFSCSKCNDVYTLPLYQLDHEYGEPVTVADKWQLDRAGVMCPDCDSTSFYGGLPNSAGFYTLTCNDCGQSWTVQGTKILGYSLYTCINCGYELKVYDDDNVAVSGSGYWAWLQRWLINFKTWLGEKFDGLGSGSDGDPIPVTTPPVSISQDGTDFNIDLNVDGDNVTFNLDTFKNKMNFVSDVYDIGSELYSSVQSGGEAPELLVYLGRANSHYGYNYGGTVAGIDLSWYEEYKPTVDSIAGGFIWLVYLFNVFKHLPGIIGGASMVETATERVDDISNGKKGRR